MLSVLEDIVRPRDCHSNVRQIIAHTKGHYFDHLLQAWERQNSSPCAVMNKVCQRTMYFSKTLAQEHHIFLCTSEYFELTRNSVIFFKCFLDTASVLTWNLTISTLKIERLHTNNASYTAEMFLKQRNLCCLKSIPNKDCND